MGKLPELTIIKDTREQKGWDFPCEEKVAGKVRFVGTEINTLDAGDYSIKGAEDLIRIERKYGFAELFGNMSPKESKDRFEREMERLRHIRHKYVLIEGNISNDMLTLSVPQIYKGPPGSSLMKWLIDLQFEYDVQLLPCGDAGKRMAKIIFEQIARKYL